MGNDPRPFQPLPPEFPASWNKPEDDDDNDGRQLATESD
jgi:hypothetical protein